MRRVTTISSVGASFAGEYLYQNIRDQSHLFRALILSPSRSCSASQIIWPPCQNLCSSIAAQVLRRAHNHKTALDTGTHNVDHESDKVDKVYR